MDILTIAAHADAHGLSLSAAKDDLEHREQKESEGCWNCPGSGVGCCEFARDTE